MLRMNPATADMFDRLAQVQPPVPAVNVEFENLTFSIRLPRASVWCTNVSRCARVSTLSPRLTDRCRWHIVVSLAGRPNHVDTVATALAGVATAVSSPPGKVYHVLNNVTGHLRPGTSTLLLAPSGHGKSTLLKALAGRLSPAQLCGNIWYGGQPMRNVNYNRLGPCCCLLAWLMIALRTTWISYRTAGRHPFDSTGLSNLNDASMLQLRTLVSLMCTCRC